MYESKPKQCCGTASARQMYALLALCTHVLVRGDRHLRQSMYTITAVYGRSHSIDIADSPTNPITTNSCQFHALADSKTLTVLSVVETVAVVRRLSR